MRLNRHRFVAVLAGLLLTVAAHGEPAAPKLAAPSAADLEKATRTLREIYKQQYADTTPAGRKKLAGELLAEAGKSKDDAVSRYLLLREAKDLATQAGDADQAMEAIAQLDASYAIDAREMRLAALLSILPKVSGAEGSAAAGKGVEMIQQALADDDGATAGRLILVVNSAVARCKDEDLKARLKEQQALLAEFTRAKSAIEKLRTDPTDPAANYQAGRYYCFFKGNWEEGLHRLANSSDAKLKELAILEQANPADGEKQKNLADGWYEWGDKQVGAMKTASLRHAAEWYRKAQPSLSGLARIAVDKRLEPLGKGQLGLGTASPTKTPSLGKSQITSASWSAPDEARGIKWFRHGDSQYTPEKLGGKDAVRTSMYWYFNIDDTFVFDLPREIDERVFVKVRLFDEKEGRLWVVYDGYAPPDAKDQTVPWKKAAMPIEYHGTGQWIERSAELYQPRLAGRLHLKTDIRLEPWKPVPALGGITVERMKIRPLAERTLKPGTVLELMPLVDPEHDAACGEWKKLDGAVSSDDSPTSTMMLPVVPSGDYQLEARFTRLKGGNAVYFSLPAGAGRGVICIDWSESKSGLVLINGKHLDNPENPTILPGRFLTDGKPATLTVMVTFQGPNVTLRSELDGKPFVHWTGPQSQLGRYPPPHPGALSISSTRKSPLQLDSMKFKMLTGTAELLH